MRARAKTTHCVVGDVIMEHLTFLFLRMCRINIIAPCISGMCVCVCISFRGGQIGDQTQLRKLTFVCKNRVLLDFTHAV